MELDELRQAILQADPSAILVAPRVLRRVLQARFRVPHMLVEVPHEWCYAFDRQTLFSHIEQDELELEPDRHLPGTVVLLARPTAEQQRQMSREETLLKYWRLLFHAHVHLALDQRRQEGGLTSAEIRARIEQIGQTEFEEIRSVLNAENCLLPPMTDVDVYVEFVAIYLELRYFRSNLRSTYFPGIRDFATLDALVRQDVDAEALFTRTRLPGAPLPQVRTDPSYDETHDYYFKLMDLAKDAANEGDTVRAAILRTRAARVAPGHITKSARALALEDLAHLTKQLQEALKFTDEEAREWQQVLPSLLDKADQGTWPEEAKLLYDLQTACYEYRQKIFALDLVEWVLSAGKRPIKRPLTSLQVVNLAKNLRSAAQRLTMARVSDEDRQELAKLLQNALQHCEQRLRERFRPVLTDAFHDVGLVPANLPEEVALQKMIEELLDRITENGFFTFSDLRDTLSRNQLKLPDLSDPDSFWRGDPLLRLDRRLATLMEGVYRKGEFYLRWMESISSLFFGTEGGRLTTINLLIPFLGAFALLMGTLLTLKHYELVSEERSLPWYTYFLTGGLILALIRVASLRNTLGRVSRLTFRTFRVVFLEIPLGLWRQPVFQQVLSSWPFLLVYWYILKPLPLWALLLLLWPDRLGELVVWKAALAFLAVNVLLNSRFGRAVNEALTEGVVLAYGWLRFEVFQNLARLLTYFFKEVTRRVEYVLYSVDEWLRFRSGESRITGVFRLLLGVVWFPISYVIRVYFLVLIEPSLNPLKLPISILAAKFFVFIPPYIDLMWPTKPGHQILLHDTLAPRTGLLLAYAIVWGIVVPTLWLLPSAVAFIIWEMKENWRLFRANRLPRLRPVSLGIHGETMGQLLKPGAHSGTVPKLYAQLRRAERSAYHTNDWKPARTSRQSLKEVARSVQVFVEREFLALVNKSKGWTRPPIKVGQVLLSCNCIRVELRHPDYPEEPVWLNFEEWSHWLIGSLHQPGWLKRLSADPLAVVGAALTGLYKLAGVDFVREQLAAVLTPPVTGYDLTADRMILRTGGGSTDQIALDLEEPGRHPLSANGNGVPPGLVLDPDQLFFSRIPITWDQWVACWDKGRDGPGHPRLLADGATLFRFTPSNA